MTARVRSLIAVAILLALAAHPLAHPLVKECPCIHEPAALEAPRGDVRLAAGGERPLVAGETVAPRPSIRVRASRGPPIA